MFKIPTIPTIVGQMDTVHNDKYKWCAGVMFVCGEETFLPAAEQVYKSFFFSFSFSNPRFFVFLTIHHPLSG